MSTDPIRGLRVSFRFADVQDREQALKNLNLELEDLDRVRGIADQGVTATDLTTLSNLTYDLEKQLIAVKNETDTYQNILSPLNDARRLIEGNIHVNGNIVAPSFKFRTVDFDDSNAIRTVDVSTSRASAWSSFGDPAESVFYGGDVFLTGNTSAIELASIEFLGGIKAKRFDSQIPTDKVTVSIDGESYDLYCMKGIPITFRCFFRSVDNLRIDVNTIGNIAPSWIVRNRSGQEFVFRNRITGTGSIRQSIISFFDSRALERDIEFYYPVSRIINVNLNNVRLFDIPNIVLPELTGFSAVNGDLVEMPNIAELYPKITTLDLSGNNLTRSKNPALNTFSPDVVQRLANSNNTLRTLILDRVYSNNCTADLSQLVNLTTFRADSTVTNSRRMTGTAPAIGPSVTSYNIKGNNFTALHSSIIASTTLRNLDISSNSIGGAITVSGTNLSSIENFVSGNNSHSLVNLSNKTSLRSYSCSNQTFFGDPTGTNIFAGCTNLSTVNIGSTNISGNLPEFSSNVSLTRFDSSNTRWSDANTNNYSIDENTFGSTTGGCRETLTFFNLTSSLLRSPIHPQAFRNMTALEELTVQSNSTNGITGSYPESINQCFNLRTLDLRNNRLENAVPDFAGNPRLTAIDLSSNQFSGDVPVLSLSSLGVLFLQNNLLTALQGIFCPNLAQLNVSSNNLQQFPSFASTPRIQNILLSNNNSIRYRAGELVNLRSLRRFEIANCGLTQGEIDQIILDLGENYNLSPRRNVLINLTGNSAPSPTETILTVISTLRRQNWTIGLDL
jgi:Leucine-rich repeat (LRR) protein